MHSCLLPHGRSKSIFLAMFVNPVAAYEWIMRTYEDPHALLSCLVPLPLRVSEILHAFVPYGCVD